MEAGLWMVKIKLIYIFLIILFLFYDKVLIKLSVFGKQSSMSPIQKGTKSQMKKS